MRQTVRLSGMTVKNDSYSGFLAVKSWLWHVVGFRIQDSGPMRLKVVQDEADGSPRLSCWSSIELLKLLELFELFELAEGRIRMKAVRATMRGEVSWASDCKKEKSRIEDRG